MFRKQRRPGWERMKAARASKESTPSARPENRPADIEELAEAHAEEVHEGDEGRKPSFLKRVSAGFQETLETSRGTGSPEDEILTSVANPSNEGLAVRRGKPQRAGERLVITEGAVIGGSLTSVSDTEVVGHVEGDVAVKGHLDLGVSGVVAGKVRAASCKANGRIDGKTECVSHLELGESGRLNADVVAGKLIALAGQVFGNITTPGKLLLTQTARVTGNIRTKRLVIEEGAIFNGRCAMRAPSEESEK